MAADDATSFADARQILDGKLATLRLIVPDAPGGEIEAVQALAERRGLREVEISAQAPAAQGRQGRVRLQLSAMATPEQASRFLDSVGRERRLFTVPAFSLEGRAGGDVRLTASLDAYHGALGFPRTADVDPVTSSTVTVDPTMLPAVAASQSRNWRS